MEKQSIVFFDGYCGLCNGFVDFVLARDQKKVFRFAPLQGSTAARLLSRSDIEDLDSVIVFSDGQTSKKSQAVFQVLRKMGPWWSWITVFEVFPRSWLDFFYDLIAKNRYAWFGKREVCRLPTPEERALFLD